MEGFNWITGALLPYLNFALFLFLAFKLFRRQVQEGTAQKHQNYIKLIEQASAARKAAEEEQQRLNARLNTLDSEIAQLKDKARVEAQKEAQHILEEAKRLAEHLKTEAHRIIENELTEARASLQEEIVRSVKDRVVIQIKQQVSQEQQVEVARQKVAVLERSDLGAQV